MVAIFKIQDGNFIATYFSMLVNVFSIQIEFSEGWLNSQELAAIVI